MTPQHTPSASAADTRTRRIDSLSARADQAEAGGDLPTLVRLRETILRLTPDWTGTAFEAGYARELASKQAESIGDGQAARHHRKRAEAHYRRELQRDPRCAVTHNNLGNLYASTARSLAATDPMAAIAALQDAIALHSRATQLDRHYAIAACNLGNDHAQLADRLADTDRRAARRYWARAQKAYAQALRIDPTHVAAAEGAGDALAAEARAIADEEPRAALALRTAALEQHARVLQLKPGNATAALDCGNDLLHLAEMQVDRDPRTARRLWSEARRHYRVALRDARTRATAEHDLGTAFLNEAKALADTHPKRALVLLASAEAHYASALTLGPDVHDSACSLGETLNLRATLTAATDLPQARRLWRRATRGLQRVQRETPDHRTAIVLLARAAIAEAEALAPIDPPTAFRLRRLATRRYRSLLNLPLPTSAAEDAYRLAQQVCEGAEAELNRCAASSRLLWRRAADGFLDAAQHHPDRAWAWNDAAYALAALGRTWHDATAAEPVALRAEVIRCCRQALRIDPNHHAAHTQWGDVHAVEARIATEAAADRGQVDARWQQALEHHQQSLTLRRDKDFSLLELARVHAERADSLATLDAAAAAAAEARMTALACLAEARRMPGKRLAAVRTEQALIALRFAGADASPDARHLAMQRVARRLLARLDRQADRRPHQALARSAAEAALGHVEACLQALDMAVLLGQLPEIDDIDRHPAFDAVRDDSRFRHWRRRRFGAASRPRR